MPSRPKATDGLVSNVNVFGADVKMSGSTKLVDAGVGSPAGLRNVFQLDPPSRVNSP